MRKKSKEDVIIMMCRFGKARLSRFITVKELHKYLEENGYYKGLNEEEEKIKRSIVRTYFEKMFDQVGSSIYNRRFSVESYFNLLEYDELQESRKTSKTATIISTIAIAISLVALGFSISPNKTDENIRLINENIKEIKTEIVE